MKTTLDYALAYASRGWKVFPVQPAPRKTPVTEHGFKEATTDRATIEEWWTDYPTAQIGCACGESGLCIIDTDEKPQQFTSGRASLDTIGVDADTACSLIMRTPTLGSRQLFFSAWNTRRQISVLPGVDILGGEGYTILPSPASPGREWVVGFPMDEDDLEPLPEWAANLCGRREAPRETGNGVSVAIKEAPLDAQQVNDIRDALGWIPAEDRGIWIKVGMALKSTGADEQGYELWREWSATHPKFDADDQLYQWDRLHALRMDGSEITLGTLFHLAKEHGWGAVESVPEVEFDGAADPRLISPGVKLLGEAMDGALQTQADINAERGPYPWEAQRSAALPVKLSDWYDVANLPMVRWMVRGLIPERSIVLLAGDTMMGKSFVAIDLAMRLLVGKDFFGRKVRPCSTLYLAGEGQQGLSARFRLWAKEHGDPGTDRYCLVSDRIPELNARSVETLRSMMLAIVEEKGHAPGNVVVDTLSQALDGDENDASVTAPILRALAALREEFDCTIQILHHTVKGTRSYDKEGNEKWVALTLNQVRGSGAITRNVDTVLGLQASRRNPEVYELLVLKQKDGTMGKPLRFTRDTFSTGRIDDDGVPETSCIIQQAEDAREEREKDPAVERVEREREGIRRLVEALVEHTELGSRDTVVRAAGLKLTDGRFYLDLAVNRKEIILLGTARRPRHVLPSHPDVPC